MTQGMHRLLRAFEVAARTFERHGSVEACEDLDRTLDKLETAIIALEERNRFLELRPTLSEVMDSDQADSFPDMKERIEKLPDLLPRSTEIL